MERVLQGRVALVMGVSRRKGIGFAVADRLAEMGTDVFCHAYISYDAAQLWGADRGGLVSLKKELQRHGTRRFLKGLNLHGMVIHPFADIVIKEVPFSNEAADGGMRTYLEKVSGDKAVKYSISRARWVSDSEVEVDWFVTSYPQFGLGGTYQLIRKNRKWIGKQIKPGSMFRT